MGAPVVSNYYFWKLRVDYCKYRITPFFQEIIRIDWFDDGNT
jgi:hypothetical protein